MVRFFHRFKHERENWSLKQADTGKYEREELIKKKYVYPDDDTHPFALGSEWKNL